MTEVQTEALRDDERFHLAKQLLDGSIEYVKTAIPLKNAMFMFKQYAGGTLTLSEKFNAVAIFDEEYRIVAEYRRGVGITYPPQPKEKAS